MTIPVEETQLILYIYITQNIFDNVIYLMKFRPTDSELVRISHLYPHSRASTYKPYKRSSVDIQNCNFINVLLYKIKNVK